SYSESQGVLNIGNLSIDKERYLIRIGDNEMVLPRKEFELLSLLVSKPSKVFTREEIFAVMEVMLVSDQKFKHIAEIIQIIIPYPLIIIFSYGDKSLINVAHKRINLTDEAKNTVEEYIYTEWIDLANKTDRQKQFIDNLDVKGLSFSNFYRFYCGVVDNINLFNASVYENNYLSIKDKDADKVKELQDKIEKLDFEINDLKGKIKKEEHFNNKMKMNIEIKKLEEKRRGLIGELK
ncbi:MAG: DUF4391 domain-containing protein, partial [Clostridia bacterium]|nr:DUF4391 domain-containing protein [Clostridia bacterium]